MAEDRIGELDARFSSADATPLAWTDVERHLEDAEIFWIATVRRDGRPHVTPLVAAWLGDAMYFTTGAGERKEINLRTNPSVVLTTGSNAFRDGLDVVLEGRAERVVDTERLRRVAERLLEKYAWRFDVSGDVLRDAGGPDGDRGGGDGPKADRAEGHEPDVAGNSAYVFGVRPTVVFAYGRGAQFSATRFRF